MRTSTETDQFVKWLSKRRDCYTAHVIANTLDKFPRDKFPNPKNDGDEEYIREQIAKNKNPDTSHLPSDGSKGQMRACAGYRVKAYKWLLEDIETDDIKQSVRKWLRENNAVLFVGAELSDIGMDSSPNREQMDAMKSILKDSGILGNFDEKFGFIVDDEAHPGHRADVTTVDEKSVPEKP